MHMHSEYHPANQIHINSFCMLFNVKIVEIKVRIGDFIIKLQVFQSVRIDCVDNNDSPSDISCSCTELAWL